MRFIPISKKKTKEKDFEPNTMKNDSNARKQNKNVSQNNKNFLKIVSSKGFKFLE